MVEAVVVDDSHFMRVQIADILEDAGIDVVGEARNGKEAIDVVRDCEPDVVTMDVKMPGMDGIEAVGRIMEEHPTPILMLSRYTEDGADTTFEALDAGAVDFFMKPDGEVSMTLVQYADELVEQVNLVAQADVSEFVPGTVDSAADAADVTVPAHNRPTVAIAASTGGPPEVQTILSGLPAAHGFRVLVVQHMPGNFTDRFAQRLDSMSELSVREASATEQVNPDEAVVAKGDYHLDVRGESDEALDVTLSEDPPVHSIRPAADVTFESLAETGIDPLVGVVLSGMGRDGAAGIDRLKEVGATTIAQDPDTAAISAMPERAIETGAIDEILPPRKIADAILEAVSIE